METLVEMETKTVRVYDNMSELVRIIPCIVLFLSQPEVILEVRKSRRSNIILPKQPYGHHEWGDILSKL